MLEKLFHITSKNVKCAICDAKAIREHEFQIQIFNDKLNENRDNKSQNATATRIDGRRWKVRSCVS